MSDPAPHSPRRLFWQSLLLSLGVSAGFSPQAKADTPAFIAGTDPGARPEGAPVVQQFRPDAAWQERALHGLEEPIPPSILGWLDDQGAWFSPFVKPGMTGPYDLRHWHQHE